MILVTGGTGFLGINLVRRLVARGERVRILRRPTSDLEGLGDLPIEHVVGDVTDTGVVRRAMAGCRRVFHLAADTRLVAFDDPAMRGTNVDGVATVCTAARELGVERLVFTSSAVTVGTGSRAAPADESSPYTLGRTRLPYIETKLAAERIVREQCEQGLPAVIVNPGYMFGEWDKSPKLNSFLTMALNGRLNFYFAGGLTVVDVADVAEGHLLAMDWGRSGERYILSNENLSFRELFTRIDAVAGRRPPVLPLPFPAVWIGGVLAETLGRLTGRNPTFSRAAARLWSGSLCVSSDRARRELGYTTTALDESLRRTLDWLRSRGHGGSGP